MVKAEKANSFINLAFPSSKAASVACRSLKPEEILPKESRCSVEIVCRKNVLCLEINAKDTAALRAAVNSFLRWVAVAYDMIKV